HLVASHRAQVTTLQSERDGQAVAAKEAAERAERARRELTSLGHERDEFRKKFTAEQSAATEYKRRTEELGNQLCAYSDAEAGWRERLSAAQAAIAQKDEALKAAVAQSCHLELNLVNLRNEHHQIYDKFKQGQEEAAKSAKRMQELEKQLKEVSAGLKQAT